jgi:hypothetical protein
MNSTSMALAMLDLLLGRPQAGFLEVLENGDSQLSRDWTLVAVSELFQQSVNIFANAEHFLRFVLVLFTHDNQYRILENSGQ